jgi:hypothetical protein
MKVVHTRRKHYCIALLGILLTAISLVAGTIGCDPAPDHFEIRNWHDLYAIRGNLGGHYLLMNDLDSTTAGYGELAGNAANQGKGWQPIGSSDDPFTGTFDGRGYEIGDMFINRPDETVIGLFAAVDVGGVIQNIKVLNADVAGDWAVGGLVGNLAGTVARSYSTGSVTGADYVGGLVGDNQGSVSNSYSTGSVTGEWYVGGLVGDNDSTGIVSNSYATASVTGYSFVGGLVGSNWGIVSNSFWDISTSRMNESDGGTGKTTAAMQDIATFADTATEGLDSKWDITAVAPGETNDTFAWNIVTEQTHPFLSWQPAS